MLKRSIAFALLAAAGHAYSADIEGLCCTNLSLKAYSTI